MAAAALAGVSARGMVNMDRAEDTLQRVIDQVGKPWRNYSSIRC